MAARAPDEALPVPNAPPEDAPEVQNQGDAAGNPLGRDQEDPTPSNTVEMFLSETRTDPRFIIAPARGFHDLSIAMVNFSNLHIILQAFLSSAFMNWFALRNEIPGTAADIDQFITNGVTALSAATIYMIYILLGSKTAHHATGYVARYRNRAPIDKYYELPFYLMRIVEKFGFWQSSEVYGNPGVMLVWDGNDAATFGLPAGFVLNQGHLNAFTQILRRLGVRFDRLNLGCPTISAWFTLLIRTASNGIGNDVFTTFPNSNYQLPFDTFLASSMMGISTILNNANGPPIEFIGYRIASTTRNNVTNELQANPDDNLNPAEQALFPAVPAGQDPGQILHRPMAGRPRVHPSGVTATRTGGTDAAPQYTRSAVIFGRGGINNVMLINRVGHNITPQDLVNFAQVVFRFGATNMA